MVRPIWKGSIAFGLVSIPVSVSSAESRTDVQLHMVDSKNHARIRYERVNADTGEEVPWDRMVKGYEHDDGKFILLTEKDLEAVQPKLTKTIDINEFVPLEDIDPILFDKPYYLEPEKRGMKAYALLREALRKTGKAGISRVVIRTREYLSAMFVRDEVIILMLLRFPQEIKSAEKLTLPLSSDKEWQPQKKDMELATHLIDQMAAEWKPQDFHDEYREALVEYIEKKVRAGDSVSDIVEGENETHPQSNVLDLTAYLQQSIKPTSKSNSVNSVKAKPSAKQVTKKHAAKKAATKKPSKSA